MRIVSASVPAKVSSLAFSTNPREVMIVFTSAAAQEARMLLAPAVKLISAGTRAADIKPSKVAAAPLALGSITPTASPSPASGANFAPSTRAPSRSLR
jgi:hypothetical protein